MVEFTAAFRERMRRKLARYAEMDKQRTTAKFQVIVDKKDDRLSAISVARNPLTWSSDEKGPSPLAYFLPSLAMCQSVHVAERAAAEGIRLDSVRFEVEGTLTVSHPRSFEDILYAVRVETPEDPARLRNLLETVANDCYVTGTLAKAQ